MTAEGDKITVIIYEAGLPTGETKELDLSDPEVAEQLQRSLREQDGEFD